MASCAERESLLSQKVDTLPTRFWADSSFQKNYRSTAIASGVNLTIPSTLVDTTEFIHVTQTIASTKN